MHFSGVINKLCRVCTNSQEDFEDYYQEVCLQIWRSRENFHEESEWSTWVYRISLNICLILLKKKGHHFVPDSLNVEETEDSYVFSEETMNLLYDVIR